MPRRVAGGKSHSSGAASSCRGVVLNFEESLREAAMTDKKTNPLNFKTV